MEAAQRPIVGFEPTDCRSVLLDITGLAHLFGGEAVHGFAFALIVGVATGTYSSIYIASPILLWLVGKHEKKVAV